MSTAFYVSYAAMWALLIIESTLLLLVYRHFGLMALNTGAGVERDGLAVGELAPKVSGVTAQNEPVLWAPQPGKISLFLFVAPGCKPCERVLPFVARLAELNPQTAVTAMVRGRPETALALAQQYAPSFSCLADDGSGAADLYQVRVTPFGFVVGTDGRVRAKGLCSDEARIERLFQQAGVRLEVPSQQRELQAVSGTVDGRVAS